MLIVKTYTVVERQDNVGAVNCCRDFRPTEYLPSTAVRVKAQCSAEASLCLGSGRMTVDTGDHTVLSTVESLRCYTTNARKHTRVYCMLAAVINSSLVHCLIYFCILVLDS